MLRFDIITIFPSMFDSYLKESILARAQKKDIISIAVHDLRDHAAGRHRTVDDSPYGGGAGMVLKIEPIWRAVRSLRLKIKSQNSKLQLKNKKFKKQKVILLSAKGKQFTQHMARSYAKLDRITFICGRYEGVDERVATHIADDEVSVGPYVLTGGELPAMVIIDAVSRLIPGVLGNAASLEEESFTVPKRQAEILAQSAVREYPQYTRPEEFKPKKGIAWKVPRILLSGDHKKIAEWRTSRQK